jgi:hypothetical protein
VASLLKPMMVLPQVYLVDNSSIAGDREQVTGDSAKSLLFIIS